MNERADQMVLDYLRRVGDVAHRKLRTDERLDFMTRLRKRIDETRAEMGAVEPEHVRRVIARFGDPSRLVERERRRLEQEREQAAPEEAQLANGRVASEEPAPESEPSTQPIPVVGDSAGPAQRSQPSQSSPWTQQSRTSTRPGQRPNSAAPWARRQRPVARPAQPAAEATTSEEPGGPTRPRHEGPPTYEETGRALPGMPRLGESMSSVDVRALVRNHRVETAAIVLLGLGGLVVPFPYTLVPLATGAACLGVARGLPARDKLIGLATPVLGLFLGVFVVGAATRSENVAFDAGAFAAAFTGYGMTFVRVGAVAGAGYLAVQLLRRSTGRAAPS